MTIHEFINKKNISQAELSRRLNISPQLLIMWIKANYLVIDDCIYKKIKVIDDE